MAVSLVNVEKRPSEEKQASAPRLLLLALGLISLVLGALNLWLWAFVPLAHEIHRRDESQPLIEPGPLPAIIFLTAGLWLRKRAYLQSTTSTQN
jgi:hypothetical protein